MAAAFVAGLSLLTNLYCPRAFAQPSAFPRAIAQPSALTTALLRSLLAADPSPDRTQAVITNLPEPERRSINDASNKVFPVFIFIPGVMGSKLTKIDGVKSKIIWGEYQGFFRNQIKI